MLSSVRAAIVALVALVVISVAAPRAQSTEAVQVSGEELRTAVNRTISAGGRGSDTPIRTIDIGGPHVGVGVLYRALGASPSGSSSHDKVTEVYQIIEGKGTLVTGGEIVNPQRREGGSELVGQVNGPGVSGSAVRGGVSRAVAPGDVIIIPAGTPHWFSEVEIPIICSVVRVDPQGIVALK